MIDNRDFEQAASALEKRHFEAAAGIAIKPSFKAMANLVRKNTRAELKRHRRTGRMRDRIKYRFKGRGLDLQAQIRSTGPQSNMIVGGVQPHAIVATGRPLPMWVGRGKSAAVEGFAQAVEHPGFPADPFFHRGIVKSMPEIHRHVQQAADAMVRLLANAMEGK